MYLQLDNCRRSATPTVWLHDTFAVLTVLLRALLLCAVTSCSVQLSPEYDKLAFATLSDLNVKTETLFASLSAGGTAQNFSNYQETYAQIIGGFSAVRVTTLNRQTPPLSARLLASPPFKTVCGTQPDNCVNPTPDHLEQIIMLLTSMRDTHKRGKLTSELVSGFNGAGGFKNQFEIEMGRVLAFESALQRSGGVNGS